jgi:hypothetical protein
VAEWEKEKTVKTVELTEEQLRGVWDSAEQWVNREKHLCEICGKVADEHMKKQNMPLVGEVVVCKSCREFFEE